MRDNRIGMAAMVFLLLALPGLAQEPTRRAPRGDAEDSLTWREADRLLRENDSHIRNARRGRETGETELIESSLEKYQRNMTRINEAVDEGNIEERDATDILERVDQATSRHTEVLSDLLTRVPEQARPAIAHALQVSQRGRSAALAALERRGGGRPEAVGKPEGAGKPEAGGKPGGGKPEGKGRAPKGGPPKGGPPKGGPPSGSGRPK